MVRVAGMLAAAVLLAGAAQAADSPVAAPTEKLQLKPRRIKGLLLGYGYTLGEYAGEVRSMAQSTRAPLFSSDKAKTTFTFSHVGGAPVTVACNGGESRLGFGWIDFKRQDLAYVCSFDGAPAGASFALALSEAGLAASLYQPQRAGELTYGGTTVRAITRKVAGALPIGGGGVMSYKILSNDGHEIGAMVRGVMQPTFYLPPAGSPDRDAAALMAMILYTFPDPANATR